MQTLKFSHRSAGLSRRQFIVYTSLAAGATALPGWAAMRKTKSPKKS
jgi:hypothetical protein